MSAPESRGNLTTTTVRFDRDQWAEIGHHARRLGIAHAAVIRDAVRAHLAGLAEREDQLRVTFGGDLDALARRVARIEQAVQRAPGLSRRALSSRPTANGLNG